MSKDHRPEPPDRADLARLNRRVSTRLKERKVAERARDRAQAKMDQIDAELAPIKAFLASGRGPRRSAGSAQRSPRRSTRKPVSVPERSDEWRTWFGTLGTLQAPVVAALVESAQGALTPPQAADRLGRKTKNERASVSTVLARLAEDGLLEREENLFRLRAGAREALLGEEIVKEALVR
jgi:hypothetical protein